MSLYTIDGYEFTGMPRGWEPSPFTDLIHAPSGGFYWARYCFLWGEI